MKGLRREAVKVEYPHPSLGLVRESVRQRLLEALGARVGPGEDALFEEPVVWGGGVSSGTRYTASILFSSILSISSSHW